jgi:hypothetical protein
MLLARLAEGHDVGKVHVDMDPSSGGFRYDLG